MTKYLIRSTRHFYPDTITNSPRVEYFGKHGFDQHAPLIPFDSKEAAWEAIREAEGMTYYLGSGEYSRPTLHIVKVDHAPARVRDAIVA